MIKNEIVEVLDSKIIDFFPEEGNWKSNCFRREEFVSEKNLPCHLRDINWLSSLIMKKYNLYSFGKAVIKEYVRDSLYFNKLRSEYEQRIVKWQITYMQSGGGNWIVESGNDEYLFSTRCDYIFRNGIVDTLLAIGMDISAIEEGVEKNVDMWQEPLMNLAFDNKFNPIFCNISFRLITHSNEEEKNDNKLQDANPVFRDCWLKYRKYEYYQAHKESIELYGNITPEMKMTDEEVISLKKYLNEQEKIRLEEIEKFRKGKNYNGAFELKEMSESGFYGLSYEDCLSKNKENEKNSVKILAKVKNFMVKR